MLKLFMIGIKIKKKNQKKIVAQAAKAPKPAMAGWERARERGSSGGAHGG